MILITQVECAKRTVLHPIENDDFVFLSEGQDFKAPKQGAFLSDFYIAEIMKAKVER